MQLRKLVLACGFVSFTLSNYVSALGLGDVKLNSKLNQPLNAEIKLLETRDLSAEQILVTLASPADFERNGVDRLYFYTEFQFEVDLKHAGGPIVKITTRNPVREPYLNFLIEARWTAGRLLREYTVLMDLPTFDTTSPQPIQAPQSVKPKISTTTKPASTSVPVVREAPSSTVESENNTTLDPELDRIKKKSKASAPGTYGPIDSKDTLWDIAKAVRPDSSVSVHQTMLAIQRLNPDAFIRGNINLLKKGQILRVPDTAEATAVSRSDAINQVAAQNNKWAGNDSDTTDLGAQLDASRPVNHVRQTSEPISGRVKLEASASGESVDGAHGSGTDKTGGKGLEAQLSSSLEELDKAKSENTELTSRVHELEEQIKTMQSLVNASNEKMRALQLNATKQAEAKPAEPSAPAAQESSVATVPAAVAEQAATSSAAAVVAPAANKENKVATAASTAEKKKAPVKHKPKEKSLVDQISDNLLWVGLGVAGIVAAGAAAFFINRRKKEEEEDAERSFAEAESFYASEPSFEKFQVPSAPVENNIHFEPEEEIPEDENTSVVAETDDVVSEAGIYISLGKYHQAEELLQNALQAGSASPEVYLKLLEVYSQTQNVTEFDKQYAALWPIGSPAQLNRASELRSAIIGAGAFDAAAQVSNQSDNLGINPSDEDINVSSRRYDLDFDKAPVSSHVTVPDDEEFVLDFDEKNKAHPDAEDLSDISSALDSLENRNDEVIADDIEVATLEDDTVESEEEISFDFNELDAGKTDFNINDTVTDLKLSDEDHADDFNLEMDVGDVDLAALDREMESLDSESTLDFSAAENATEILADDKERAEFEALFEENDVADVNNEVADEDTPAFDINEEQKPDVLDPIPFEPSITDTDHKIESEAFASGIDEVNIYDNAKNEFDNNASLSDLDKELQGLNGGKTEKLIINDEDIDEHVFNEAMSDFSAEGLAADIEDMADENVDAELDFMVDTDEAATKLDLARAYLDMGDNEGARDILAEVAQEGNAQQREEAIGLLSKIDV